MNNKDTKEIIIVSIIIVSIMFISFNRPATIRRIGDYYMGIKNPQEAEKYYKYASQKGDIKANFNYSCLLIDKDPEKALKLAIVAADGGLPEAMYNAGTLFLKKSPPDLENAEKYLQLALKNDIKKSYTNLGICSQLTSEKEKDKNRKKEYEEKAFEYFKKGAENNDDLSMIYLGYYYANKKEFEEAKKWLNMAKKTENTNNKPEKMMKELEELVKKNEK